MAKKSSAQENPFVLRYEVAAAQLQSQGFRPRDLTVGILKANLLGPLLTLPFVAVEIALFLRFREYRLVFYSSLWYDGLLLAILVLLIVTHELILGLFFGMFTKSRWKAIHFGVLWHALTPYCAMSEPLTKGQYILGAAMPTAIFGTLLTAIAVSTGSPWCLDLAVLMTLGGAGDLLIIAKLAGFRSTASEVLYYDHPTACALVAFER